MLKKIARGLVRAALWIIRHPDDVADLVEEAKRLKKQIEELRGRPAGVAELTIGPER